MQHYDSKASKSPKPGQRLELQQLDRPTEYQWKGPQGLVDSKGAPNLRYTYQKNGRYVQ